MTSRWQPPAVAVEKPASLDEFGLYDADGDGSITCDEFCELLSSVGTTMSLTHRKAVFDQLDQDQDGRVSEQEYLRWQRT